MKKRDWKKERRWTTKGHAWLERRDDGAGKERERKKRKTMVKGGKGIDGEMVTEGEREREREKEEAPRLSRPNELSGSGTKIIIEISCRWTKHLKKDCLPLISHRRICLQNYNQATSWERSCFREIRASFGARRNDSAYNRLICLAHVHRDDESRHSWSYWFFCFSFDLYKERKDIRQEFPGYIYRRVILLKYIFKNLTRYTHTDLKIVFLDYQKYYYI